MQNSESNQIFESDTDRRLPGVDWPSRGQHRPWFLWLLGRFGFLNRVRFGELLLLGFILARPTWSPSFTADKDESYQGHEKLEHCQSADDDVEIEDVSLRGITVAILTKLE